MSRPLLEVADIIRAHGPAFLEVWGDRISSAKKRVLHLLVACRTAVLGGHVEQCDQCAHQRIAYNSCRNRHCPKCQAAARADWLEARQADLLPVEYFHVVFTVPEQIAAIALQNKKVVYGILFEALAQTLKQIAADPKHLGAEIGFISVLHTWGQNLRHHPHVHCVVPGGGLSSDGTRWIACKPGFFLPVKVLGRVFRGKFLEKIRKAYSRGELVFQGSLEHLEEEAAFARHLQPAYALDWVVYAKPPFGGPEQVLKYLARYTHRVAISNHRLLEMKGGEVTFSYKDYARGNRPRKMTIEATEFIRRFLLHVLPRGFMRIRHHGFLANRARATKLELCRRLLGQQPHPGTSPEGELASEDPDNGETREQDICPACGTGHMMLLARLSPEEALARLATQPIGIDSS